MCALLVFFNGLDCAAVRVAWAAGGPGACTDGPLLLVVAAAPKVAPAVAPAPVVAPVPAAAPAAAPALAPALAPVAPVPAVSPVLLLLGPGWPEPAKLRSSCIGTEVWPGKAGILGLSSKLTLQLPPFPAARALCLELVGCCGLPVEGPGGGRLALVLWLPPLTASSEALALFSLPVFSALTRDCPQGRGMEKQVRHSKIVRL